MPTNPRCISSLCSSRIGRRAWLVAILLLAVSWLAPSHAPRADSERDPIAASEPASGIVRPFLWRVAQDPPSYLFGTIHLPDARVLALPPSVERALNAADVVYTEIPMDMATQVALQQRMLLEEGAVLASILPSALNRRLEAELERYQAPMFLMRRLKVWAVATMLPLLEWSQGRPSGQPALDQAIADRARDQGKEVDAVETVDDQIAALESLGRKGEIALLRQTLDYLEAARKRGEDPIERLLQVYLTGDEERLLKVASEQFDASGGEVSQQLEEALLRRRNRTMEESIAQKLRDEPDRSHFFAIGALHFPGPEGIVASLRARGFQVERITP